MDWNLGAWSDSLDDETLPNFIKWKRPRKGGKKKQGASTKVQASKQPKRGEPQGGNGTTKNWTLQQQLHEEHQLKTGGGKPNKTHILDPFSMAYGEVAIWANLAELLSQILDSTQAQMGPNLKWPCQVPEGWARGILLFLGLVGHLKSNNNNINATFQRPIRFPSHQKWEYITGLLEPNMGHNQWAIRRHRTEWHSGRVGSHTPLSHEYANGPIWACSHYHRSRAVPIWLTQYWVDMTCDLSALNECHDATSPKTPDKPVLKIDHCCIGGFRVL